MVQIMISGNSGRAKHQYRKSQKTAPKNQLKIRHNRPFYHNLFSQSVRGMI